MSAEIRNIYLAKSQSKSQANMSKGDQDNPSS